MSRWPPRTLRERFDEKWSLDAETGCHIWTAYKSPEGYGFMNIGGKPRQGTHIALELSGRPRPAGKFHALHRCDNPPCVNPAHLWWGTNAENVRDMIAKGRGTPITRRAVPCAQCGATVVRNPYRLKLYAHSFCSASCRNFFHGRRKSA